MCTAPRATIFRPQLPIIVDLALGSLKRPVLIMQSAVPFIHYHHTIQNTQFIYNTILAEFCLFTTFSIPISTKMAVQSTMQPINTKIYNHQHLSQWEQSFDSTATSPTILVASTACYSAVDLPLADPFASDIISISHKRHTGIHGDGYYGTDPSDGHTVWYCSDCGDGPMGTWIPACTACGHSLCGSCTVEKAS